MQAPPLPAPYPISCYLAEQRLCPDPANSGRHFESVQLAPTGLDILEGREEGGLVKVKVHMVIVVQQLFCQLCVHTAWSQYLTDPV